MAQNSTGENGKWSIARVLKQSDIVMSFVHMESWVIRETGVVWRAQ